MTIFIRMLVEIGLGVCVSEPSLSKPTLFEFGSFIKKERKPKLITLKATKKAHSLITSLEIGQYIYIELQEDMGSGPKAQ